MRIRPLVTAAATVAMAMSGVLPAEAGQQAATFTISVEPDAVHPAESTTVSGETSGPACAEDGVDVTLTYTKPNGGNGTVTVQTTTTAEGTFSVPVTVPDDAVAGDPASVTAVIADCTASEGATRTAKAVPLEIEAYEGTLTAQPATGRPGTKVRVNGTNCWGGEVAVVFTDGETGEDVKVTLSGNKNFTGVYTIPDAPSGDYAFVAECPGTDYNIAPFRLVNPEPAKPLPPRPITGPVRYTG
jgi:hypothetical protein